MASKHDENIFMNKISLEQRFAKRDDKEYHVFSLKCEDASKVENWLHIKKPLPVLIDPESFEELKNKKMNWVFDKEKTLIGCVIKN